MSRNERKPGRPQGSTNAEVGQVVAVHQCKQCKSSERERYRLVNCVAHGGVTASGIRYSHVVFRRTKCKQCGTSRVDKFLENRAPDVSPGSECEPL